MFDNLEELEKKYVELTKQISDPAVIAKQDEWQKMMKEQSSLEPRIQKSKARFWRFKGIDERSWNEGTCWRGNERS